MSDQVFSTEQILQSGAGSLIPEGAEFWGKVTNIEGKVSSPVEGKAGSGGRAFVQVTWTVLDGTYEGLDATNTYWIGINKRQDGSPSAKSLLELLMACKAVNQVFPAHAFKENPGLGDAHAIAKIVAGIFKPAVTPRFRLKAVAEPIRKQNSEGKWVNDTDDDGKLRTRIKFAVVPLPKPGDAPAAAPNVQSPGAGNGNAVAPPEPANALDLV